MTKLIEVVEVLMNEEMHQACLAQLVRASVSYAGCH